MLPWAHTCTQTLDVWLTLGLSFYLVFQLGCTHGCLSDGQLTATTVYASLPFVSELTIHASLPTCLPVLLPVFVPGCIHRLFLAVGAAFCHLAERWSVVVILWGRAERLGTQAGDSRNKTVAWWQGGFHKQVIMWSKLASHHHWHYFCN